MFKTLGLAYTVSAYIHFHRSIHARKGGRFIAHKWKKRSKIDSYNHTWHDITTALWNTNNTVARNFYWPTCYHGGQLVWRHCEVLIQVP